MPTTELIGQPQTFEQMIDMVYADARKVALNRQAKYGPHNIPEFGVKGIIVRMYDKIQRVIFFWWEGAPKPDDEADEDPFIDIINYAIFCICVMRGYWTKKSCPPLERPVTQEKTKGYSLQDIDPLHGQPVIVRRYFDRSDLATQNSMEDAVVRSGMGHT